MHFEELCKHIVTVQCLKSGVCAGACMHARACVCLCYRDNIVSDCFQGCFIVTCTLCTFISLVWLREQILHGGGPDWLDQEPALANHRQVSPVFQILSIYLYGKQQRIVEEISGNLESYDTAVSVPQSCCIMTVSVIFNLV